MAGDPTGPGGSKAAPCNFVSVARMEDKAHCPCSQTAVLPSGQSSSSCQGPLLGPGFGQRDAHGSNGLAWSPLSGATGT